MAIRSLWAPGARWQSGINFCGKTLLEIAVMLLGVSLSFQTVATAGPWLFLGIVGVVGVSILASYGLCRLFGLHRRIAMLVACGNSICGNSAIAAVAPVIRASGTDIASSIAFTAVLGVLVVLGLPFLIPLLDLSVTQYGALAGLTVYAVPQVLAATMPIGTAATQIGTLIKLVRVLMLGPVILGLSLLIHRRSNAKGQSGFPPLHRLVPWFILGFVAMMALRSFDLVPHVAMEPVALITNLLTVISMAALGLGVDVRAVAKAGGRVTAAVTGSLIVLGGISYGLIRLLGMA